MKLKDLTKKYKKIIEADELAEQIFFTIKRVNKKVDNYTYSYKDYILYIQKLKTLRQELKRTIKRIDEEIKFLRKPYFRIDKYRFKYTCDLEPWKSRIKELEKQKKLYELIEKLE